MNANDIEAARRAGATPPELYELALDGIKFRAWVWGASHRPSVVAKALAPCLTVDDYRRAIEGLLARGEITLDR